jgi:alpha-glucosidase (family GH31 glycosyl hydrolase)
MPSHRTLENDAQIVSIVDTFHKKQIPIDAVICLVTGFTPRGWKTNQPSFEFNRSVFKREPKEVLSDLHARHAKAVVHMIPSVRTRVRSSINRRRSRSTKTPTDKPPSTTTMASASIT